MMEKYKKYQYEIQVDELKDDHGFSGSVRVLYDVGDGPVTQGLYPQEKIISTDFDEVRTRLSQMAIDWIDANL